MNTDFHCFVRIHPCGEQRYTPASTAPGAPCGVANPRHGKAIAAVCALPGIPVTALADVFNYRF
ncbi:hypothetical protein [Comamonas terrae]|uniref:Uncharacterized protein n=1 Tax=Comamonas terrae TaxID=673548 RepID=A0ABW5UJX0_9BURK|nr:hypothetical protein [Comamonas terrae]